MGDDKNIHKEYKGGNDIAPFIPKWELELGYVQQVPIVGGRAVILQLTSSFAQVQAWYTPDDMQTFLDGAAQVVMQARTGILLPPAGGGLGAAAGGPPPGKNPFSR